MKDPINPKSNPAQRLFSATARLGSLDVEKNDAVYAWTQARADLFDMKRNLAKLPLLRKKAAQLHKNWARVIVDRRGLDDDPLPADARRLWSAVAARNAILSVDFSIKSRDEPFLRLLAQKEIAVKQLCAAAAKVALRKKLSPESMAGLIRLVSAVSSAGSAQGDGARATRHREDLAAAMQSCASSVPCWIMPCWRVSQSLPAEIGSFDLLVIDEASQSDITALPVLLRGQRIPVVGDSKQVSPTGGFISEKTISDLKSRLFASPTRHPFIEQLLPGRSIFDLAQTCFADARVALNQHFRCVPQCIALSNKLFYHSQLQPRRLPQKSERLVPAIVSIRVPGKKVGKKNEIEAKALVKYLVSEISEDGELARRNCSVGIISLMGSEQVRYLRTLVLQNLSDAQLSKHKILVRSYFFSGR